LAQSFGPITCRLRLDGDLKYAALSTVCLCIAMPEIKLEPSWKSRLEQEFAADYMQRLGQFLRAEKAAGVKIYPPGAEIFMHFR